MSENEKKELQPIDLFAMLHNFSRLLRRSWYLVIAAAALLGAVMGFRAYTSYAPQYRCEAVLSAEYVTDNYGYTDVQGYGSNYSSTMSISQIINTFSSIINTDAMRQQMLNELGTSSINGTIVPAALPTPTCSPSPSPARTPRAPTMCSWRSSTAIPRWRRWSSATPRSPCWRSRWFPPTPSTP